MAYLVGSLIGALIGVYLVYSLLHWAIFKRVTPDPTVSNLLAAVVAYVVSSTIYGFTSPVDGSFNANGFIGYLVPSLIIGALAFKRGRDKANDESLHTVFE